MATVNLKSAAERVSAGQEAGDSYISALESIRDTLTDDGKGASLGTMVGARLEMTEVETRYMVESSIPKKASGANQAAAQEVKKAAG